MSTSRRRSLLRGRYRWPLRLAVLVIAGLALLGWAYAERSRNVLTVENRSGQTISLLHITAAGQTSEFRDVASGAEVTASFRIKGDDHFAVEGRLADGTLIRGQFRSVTSGMSGERAHLVVLPGGQIVFRPGGKTSP